ncbi:MAG: 23S rRNA (guanosine(2251)-2'-O)-methyltransferase RlmB [Candidatus Limnocylindria bacterium]
MNEQERDEPEATGEAPTGDTPTGDTANDADDPNRRGRRRGRRGRGGPPVAGQPPFRPQTPGFRPQVQGARPAPGFRPAQPGFRPQGQGFRPQGPRPQGQGFRPQPQGFRPQQPSFRGQPTFRPAPPPEARPGEDEGSLQAREVAAYERRQEQQDRRGQWRGGGAWRPRGPQRPGANYAETIRRATAGPRSAAAPSHDAGEPIAGSHAVLEAIRAGRGMRRLYVSQDRGTHSGPVAEVIAEAQQRGIAVQFVDKLEIARVSPIEGHQGVVAIVEGRPGVDLDELLLHLDAVSEPGLVLLIDSLQDPQNFGVLLRSAEGAGVDGVVIPRHRSVGLTPAVAKTSAGASEHLLVADVANLRQAIDALKEKGLWVVGTDETGDLLYDEVDYRGPTAVVIGGEGEGIRRLVLEGCDQVVRIPMSGRVSSLNAAAAGTVVLYEALRQRRRDVAPPGTRTAAPERPRDDTQVSGEQAGEAEFAESRLVADRDAARGASGEGAAPSSSEVRPASTLSEGGAAPAIRQGAPASTLSQGRDPSTLSEGRPAPTVRQGAPATGRAVRPSEAISEGAPGSTPEDRLASTVPGGAAMSTRSGLPPTSAPSDGPFEATTEGGPPVAEGEIVAERESEHAAAQADASAVIDVSVSEDAVAPDDERAPEETDDPVIDVAVTPTPVPGGEEDAAAAGPGAPRPPGPSSVAERARRPGVKKTAAAKTVAKKTVTKSTKRTTAPRGRPKGSADR